jgi:hypothetical protein
MNADGSNQSGLTAGADFDDYSPAWSPDGRKITFSRYMFHTNLIYVLNVDESAIASLTYDGQAFSPDWQRIPGPVPTPLPAQTLNLSTRMGVAAGERMPIAGFIITGSEAKSVVVRGIGLDPILELRANDGGLIAQNDDWQNDPAQAAQLTALGLALPFPADSGIAITLQPGTYSAILREKNETAGPGLVEIYDVNSRANSQLANISTRGFVQTDDNVMIGGFILAGDTRTRVAVRGIGPSLAQFGLAPVLADPTLRLVDGNGYPMDSNDDWGGNPELSLLGLGLQDPSESGILISLAPGPYTVILSGKNNGVGLGMIEIYNVP